MEARHRAAVREMSMIRYEKLGFVHLNVTDLSRSRRFYEEVVGLQFIESGSSGELRFRCSGDRYNVVLHQSTTPGFRALGLMLESDQQFDVLERRLQDRGIAHEEISAEECADRYLARVWRISEPHMQAAFEFYRPLPVGPDAIFEPTVAKIQRIGHVVFGTPHYAESIGFLRETLNFAPSDEVDNIISFFRAFPNPYHHGIGIGRAPRNLLHHVNFMVTEIDDIGIALNRFKAHDVPVVFGPGRHIASNSVFLYFLDPDGLTLEYSFGMEEFPETDPRGARVLPPVPASIDSWGGQRDARMSATGDVEPYAVGAGWSVRDPQPVG